MPTRFGFTATWDELRSKYWKNRSPESEKGIAAFLTPETVKTVYTHGHARPELISPDNWNMDNHFLERPGAKQVQLDFFYDYRTNVELYPKWQAFLKERQPKTVILWGQNDIFFTPEGGEAYLGIFAGAGCAGAHDEVVATAARLKAPMAHTSRGKDFVEHDNPYNVGMTGILGGPAG
jgi:hypothetical protein